MEKLKLELTTEELQTLKTAMNFYKNNWAPHNRKLKEMCQKLEKMDEHKKAD